MAKVLKATAALLIAFALFVYALQGLLDEYGHGYQPAINSHNYCARPMPSASMPSPCLGGSWVLWRSGGVQADLTLQNIFINENQQCVFLRLQPAGPLWC